jgi:hypothetical protein
VNIGVHARSVCHGEVVADGAEPPQDIRSAEAEHPQEDVVLRAWAFALRDLVEETRRHLELFADGAALPSDASPSSSFLPSQEAS